MDDVKKAELQIIFDDLIKELEYAEKWGEDFDNKNTINDWVTFINMYASDAAKLKYSDPSSPSQDPKEIRKKLVKAAGLCFSAIRKLDLGGFAPRHYDK